MCFSKVLSRFNEIFRSKKYKNNIVTLDIFWKYIAKKLIF